MPVRQTESRMPLNLQPADLGQAVEATDGRCSLISFVTSPMVISRPNVYVVFITDSNLGSSAFSYEWVITENNAPPVTLQSDAGEITYIPRNFGKLEVSVRILDSGTNELAALLMEQEVTEPSVALEEMINEAIDQPGPSMADPDVLRELINEHNLYYQSVTPAIPENGEGYKRLVFNMVYDGASRRNQAQRKQLLDQIASSLNTQDVEMNSLNTEGAGVCRVRLELLAMTIPSMIPWTLFPADANQRLLAESDLRKQLSLLDTDKQIDLFNIVRFPKTNIMFCGRTLEKLRNEYFPGTNFDDVLTGMDGVRAQWIIAQYQKGPVIRN